MTHDADLTRRTLLVAGGAGTALALAACAPGDPNTDTDAGTASPAEVAVLSDIPVGGAIAVMFDGAQIIVSQPTAGEVVAFSAICTHQGCIVVPEKKGLNCPCHKSLFDTATGAVIQGPATDPLPAVTVTLDGDKVLAG
ncbi:hypothetical protein B7495_09860 [Cryobacterium sp. LW097]|uniref:QcrA and Rieske domain-containing protein n=1 Tax=unclassified Cryobacterium TaxID=2649013 RepID=UPI000B4D7DA6|nr:MULTISPECIES: Rieske (2Fe-2S) protein [unclassified Cryobacterium]ASD22354.1 hypothetical protein B7495_09860 [Cryobacterium sp. LW097]TFC57326.1 Rieske (2Fe-2S) protein [Cryobacterium sp. TMB1-7]